MEAAEDLFISPTYVPDLVEASLDLMIDGETGLRHLANGGETSWAAFAVRLASAMGLDPDLVRPMPSAHFRWPAARPSYVPLATSFGDVMPHLDDAIARFAAEIGTAMAMVADPAKAQPGSRATATTAPNAVSADGRPHR